MSDHEVRVGLFRDGAERRFALVATLALFGLLVVMWLGWPRLADRLAAGMTNEFRANRGAADYRALFAGLPVCSDVAGQDALQELAQKLAGDDPRLRAVRISVVDWRVPNAFTLPDQRVVVTSGLLEEVESVDELALILGHEFGHVLHDDDTRGYLRAWPGRLLAQLLGPGMAGLVVSGDSLVGTAYTREFERAADRTGIQLVRAANIRGSGAIRFFTRRLEPVNPPGTRLRAMSFLATHPADAERAATVAQARLQGGSPGLGDAAWARLVTICGRPAPLHELPDAQLEQEIAAQRERLRASLHETVEGLPRQP